MADLYASAPSYGANKSVLLDRDCACAQFILLINPKLEAKNK
jgi:hypothetical protein